MLGFRVWDSERKIMSDPKNVFTFYPFKMDIFGVVKWHNEKLYKHFFPMQSTGLFDQMEKEMFEQDCIMVGQLDGDYRPEIFIVVESIPKIYNLLMGRYRNHPFTIIGNSFEHPELLEKCDARI